MERIILLSGLLVVLIPLFLWHRWRFVNVRAPVLPPETGVLIPRAALVPEFIQWLKSQAVQSLMRQREELRSTQQLAELELARLEQMLIRTHAPLHERLRQYEVRIAQLEEAVKATDHHNAEVIQSMIRLTRQKLEAEG